MLSGTIKALAPRRLLHESANVTTAKTSIRGLIPFIDRDQRLSSEDLQVLIYSGLAITSRLPALTEFTKKSAQLVSLSKHPAWLNILHSSLGHEPYLIEATAAGQTVGFLPLTFLDTILFGKFLVSLPYLNTNGVVAANPMVQTALIERAISLGDELNSRHIELRHEIPIDHIGFNARISNKVHMRLVLPETSDQLWKSLDSKVRNQIRKGEKPSFRVAWGGVELLAPFYDVLTQKMRDLGSPIYGIELFREILTTFPGNAEIVVVGDNRHPVAAALLLHGWGVTEVPTASSLKRYNSTSANMLMYWHLLQRAIKRGQHVFDFGRSTIDGSTYRFKKQWGAESAPAIWQYRVNRGEVGEMRPDNPRFQRAIRIWQKLPLALTRLLGPHIVRGIP
jgi:FemAB-related protein (PEP-CTERM system-associated)